MGNIKDYAKLIRPYGMLYLGLTPVFGAICNGEFNLSNLFLLVVIGLSAHVFTFVQNDIFDIEVDKKSSYVTERPLVSGVISKRAATAIVLFSFLLSIIIASIFLFTFLSFILLFVSFLLVTIYNKFSKKIFGMEYILAIGIFTYGLFGALTVGDDISNLAIIISFVAMMQWIFSVGIFANLKDVKYDTKAGVKTTPAIFGVKAIKNTLKIPSLFKIYAFGLKTLHIIIAALAFIFSYTSLYVFNLPIPSISFILLSGIILYLVKKILSTPLSNRDKMLVYEGLQEGLAFLLIPIVLLSYLFENIGIIQTLFLIALMIIWPLSSLRIVFGKKLIPLE